MDEKFQIYIEDMKGKVVVDETRQSQPNGFIDIWLPRDQEYIVKIEHESGKKIEAEISTFQNDGTCITNLQLL